MSKQHTKDPVLIAFHPVYKPVPENIIGSFSRVRLQSLGVDTKAWGAHSTRGAFVSFYKQLRLTTYVVAEIGQGTNFEVFGKHYLRSCALQQASHNVDRLLQVHTSSPLNGGLGETSITPKSK